jgi:ABC-2 type transport system permease protein
MRLYLEVAKKSFQKHLAYRAANLAGILTNSFFGAIYVFIYVALFQERGQVGGLDLRDTITYVIISQSLLMAMSAFGNHELSQSIIKGVIVTDLSRPVDFYAFWAATDLGRAVYYFLFRGVPTFVVGWLLFSVRLPVSPLNWGLFLLSVTMGMLVSFAFRFIISSLAFWVTDARGLYYLTNTVIMFFSGFIVPLNFFPDALRAAVEWLPFRALVNLPVGVYLGKVSALDLAQALALQTAWLVAMALFGRALLSRMVRRITIQGG